MGLGYVVAWPPGVLLGIETRLLIRAYSEEMDCACPPPWKLSWLRVSRLGPALACPPRAPPPAAAPPTRPPAAPAAPVCPPGVAPPPVRPVAAPGCRPAAPPLAPA